MGTTPFELLHDLVRTPVTEIVQRLKRSPGMSVKELCSAMKMSYMGVKQHCDDLHKKGYLDTWRRAKAAGRPEKIYRLTHKLDPLFPQAGEGALLELLATAQRVFGDTAPEKLLYSLFQARAERYAPLLAAKASLQEKVEALAKLRSAEGCMSVREIQEDGTLSLVDYHCPYAELARTYDILPELECDMIERLLGSQVERQIEEHSGLIKVRFVLGGKA